MWRRGIRKKQVRFLFIGFVLVEEEEDCFSSFELLHINFFVFFFFEYLRQTLV